MEGGGERGRAPTGFVWLSPPPGASTPRPAPVPYGQPVPATVVYHNPAATGPPQCVYQPGFVFRVPALKPPSPPLSPTAAPFQPARTPTLTPSPSMASVGKELFVAPPAADVVLAPVTIRASPPLSPTAAPFQPARTPTLTPSPSTASVGKELFVAPPAADVELAPVTIRAPSPLSPTAAPFQPARTPTLTPSPSMASVGKELFVAPPAADVVLAPVTIRAPSPLSPTAAPFQPARTPTLTPSPSTASVGKELFVAPPAADVELAPVTIRAPSPLSPTAAPFQPAPSPPTAARVSSTAPSPPTPAPATTPSPSTASVTEEKLFVLETAAVVAASKEGQVAGEAAPDVDLKKGLAHPARPGARTIGEKVTTIRANHFLAENNLFHDHYDDVSINLELNSRAQTRQILIELIKSHVKASHGGELPDYDGRKSLYTAGSLPFEPEESVVTLVVKERAERDYKITIRIAGRPRVMLPETIQVLDVALKESASISRENVSRSFFPTTFSHRVDIVEGLECCSAYYQRQLPRQMELLFDTDLSGTSFFKPETVLQFVKEFLNLGDTSRPLSDRDRMKNKKVLRGVCVETNHQQGQIIQLIFPVDKGGVKMTVVQSSMERCNYRLQYTYSFLQFDSASQPKYLSMEVCKIVEGQMYLHSLIDKIVVVIDRAPCHRTLQREESIREVQMVLHNKYAEGKFAQEFRIIVCTDISNPACVLPPPTLRFHDSGWEKTYVPSVGQWNMANKISINLELNSRAQTREILIELINSHVKASLRGKLPDYDGRKSLYIAGSLPFEPEQFVVTLVVKERVERDYKITIRIAGRTDSYHRRQFLCGKLRDMPPETIQVLDVALKESASISRENVSRSFFPTTFSHRGDIFEGVECCSAYYQSQLPRQMELSFDTDLSWTSFFKPEAVFQFVKELLNLRDTSRPLSDRDRMKNKKALRGDCVETNHQHGQIRRFPIGKGGAKMTVIRSSMERCNYGLQYTTYSFLQSDSDSQRKYFSMEVCKIVEGQRYLHNLIDKIVVAIYRAPCQRTQEREQSFRKVVLHNKYAEGKFAQKLGIIVCSDISNPACVVPPPMFRSCDSGWEKTYVPSVGQWNMVNKASAPVLRLRGGATEPWETGSSQLTRVPLECFIAEKNLGSHWFEVVKIPFELRAPNQVHFLVMLDKVGIKTLVLILDCMERIHKRGKCLAGNFEHTDFIFIEEYERMEIDNFLERETNINSDGYSKDSKKIGDIISNFFSYFHVGKGKQYPMYVESLIKRLNTVGSKPEDHMNKDTRSLIYDGPASMSSSRRLKIFMALDRYEQSLEGINKRNFTEALDPGVAGQKHAEVSWKADIPVNATILMKRYQHKRRWYKLTNCSLMDFSRNTLQHGPDDGVSSKQCEAALYIWRPDQFEYIQRQVVTCYTEEAEVDTSLVIDPLKDASTIVPELEVRNKHTIAEIFSRK